MLTSTLGKIDSYVQNIVYPQPPTKSNKRKKIYHETLVAGVSWTPVIGIKTFHWGFFEKIKIENFDFQNKQAEMA